MKKVLVIHGPNLDILGRREPQWYGTLSLADLNGLVAEHARRLGLELEIVQSNHEGEMVDVLNRSHGRVDGVVINPGALTHYGLSLRDALAAVPVPCVEVHLTNLYRRAEPFRRRSVTAGACWGVISGFGPDSYVLALEALARRLNADSAPPAGQAVGG